MNKEKRERCWKNRDEYFKCLDKNGDDETQCLKEQKFYHDNCIPTWVNYFDRLRKIEKYKKKLENKN
ncbi:hypothetical protein SNEBB_004120 [Seison nebaliae]|nr:hypothetical protein SNEBB_004120 [Seison nebaliae]